MSELANKIRQLRGDLSQLEFARKVNLSIRTITKIEAGEKPKRSNILQIADKLSTSRAERLSLLLSWLRAEMGDEDFQLLNVMPKLDLPSKSNPVEQLCKAATNLPVRDQNQLLLACGRRVVLNSLAALNDLYDKVNQPQNGAPPGDNSGRKSYAVPSNRGSTSKRR